MLRDAIVYFVESVARIRFGREIDLHKNPPYPVRRLLFAWIASTFTNSKTIMYDIWINISLI